jgi:NAD(P)-dependent dehydrogenase (short-subunit alcohol dehydrogenase family)
MDLGLQDRVVLLTGGSGGIGGPTALLLAAEGARVALTYHRKPTVAEKVVRRIERSGGIALVLPYDLADPDSIRQTVDTVVAEWGGVDVLVAAASPADGPNPRPLPFEDIPATTWQGQLRPEVEGAFHTVSRVVPLMKARGWGRMVFVSANVVDRGFPGEEAYVASKAALHGLSRTLATELADYGVLVNVVAPGPTVTDRLLDKVDPKIRREAAGRTDVEVKALLNQRMPHLRFSTPADVARVIAFLASAANGNVSGAVVPVAGSR